MFFTINCCKFWILQRVCSVLAKYVILTFEISFINAQRFLKPTGEVALHLAIVHRNFELISEFVRMGADVRNPRANGIFFSYNGGGCYYGEILCWLWDIWDLREKVSWKLLKKKNQDCWLVKSLNTFLLMAGHNCSEIRQSNLYKSRIFFTSS